MKKAIAGKSQRKPKQMIHMCCDRILTGAAKIKAMDAAFAEHNGNRPPARKAAAQIRISFVADAG